MIPQSRRRLTTGRVDVCWVFDGGVAAQGCAAPSPRDGFLASPGGYPTHVDVPGAETDQATASHAVGASCVARCSGRRSSASAGPSAARTRSGELFRSLKCSAATH